MSGMTALSWKKNLAADFTFTSPFDDHIDRAAYFKRCWPKQPLHQKFDFVTVMQDGDKVMIAYDCTMHIPNSAPSRRPLPQCRTDDVPERQAEKRRKSSLAIRPPALPAGNSPSSPARAEHILDITISLYLP